MFDITLFLETPTINIEDLTILLPVYVAGSYYYKIQ